MELPYNTVDYNRISPLLASYVGAFCDNFGAEWHFYEEIRV